MKKALFEQIFPEIKSGLDFESLGDGIYTGDPRDNRHASNMLVVYNNEIARHKQRELGPDWYVCTPGAHVHGRSFSLIMLNIDDIRRAAYNRSNGRYDEAMHWIDWLRQRYQGTTCRWVEL